MRGDSVFIETDARRLTQPGKMRATPPKPITGAGGVCIADMTGHAATEAVGGRCHVDSGNSCGRISATIAAQVQRLPYSRGITGTTKDAAIALPLTLPREYHRPRGVAGRAGFIAMRKGHHGSLRGGTSANRNPRFREFHEPILSDHFHIPTRHARRNPSDKADPGHMAQSCPAVSETSSDRAVKAMIPVRARRIAEATDRAGIRVRRAGTNPGTSPSLVLAGGDCDRVVAVCHEGPGEARQAA